VLIDKLCRGIDSLNRPELVAGVPEGRPLPSDGERGTGCTVIEISPVARPHGQAPNLNPNGNLARPKLLEIKSKITIKIRKKPFCLNSMAVGTG